MPPTGDVGSCKGTKGTHGVLAGTKGCICTYVHTYVCLNV